MYIIIYILTAYGLTNLLVFGTGPFNILTKLREFAGNLLPTLGDMLDCMMCTSANVGWIASALNIIYLPDLALTPFNLILEDTSLWYLIIPLDLCFTSGTVWLIHTFQEALERIK